MDETLDARPQRGLKQVARALDVGRVHPLRALAPQAVFGGDVADGSAAARSLGYAGCVSQIADDDFSFDASQGGPVAGRPYEQAQALSATCEEARHMIPDETR